MRLPLPKRIKDVLYTEAEVSEPTVNAAIETQKMAKSGSFFQSLRAFCNSCVDEFKTSDGQSITDPISIKSIIPKLPFKTVEYLALQAVLKHNDGDDGIEGMYPCPRCGHDVIAEYSDRDGVIIDTRDHISKLTVKYSDDEQGPITVDLATPVLIQDKVTNEVIEEVKSLTIEAPTLEKCIAAEGKTSSDRIRLQLAIYVECLIAVNGQPIDSRYRDAYGMYIFGNIRSIKKDLKVLSDSINQFGLDTSVEKECPKCGKVWRAQVNTSNFFASAPLSF